MSGLFISTPLVEGVALTLIAGVMSGNCMLPMKFAQRWRFENTWLVFSMVSLLLLPWTLGFALVHHLLQVYRDLSVSKMMAPFLFGAGWGVAQILFGISVRRLGLGVGYAIIVGLGAVLGTLVPLFAGQRTLISHSALFEILAGVAMMVVGIALAAWSGQMRERGGRIALPDGSQQRYTTAILLAVLCGFMAPMLNFAFTFGQSLAVEAVRLGNTPIAAAYAVWPVALLGGLLPNLGYSLYLIQRHQSWIAFRERSRNFGWATLMGVLWMGAFALYGMSAVYLGALGTSIGWGLFQIFMIMTATLSGLLTAEWKHASIGVVVSLVAGMSFLIGATFLLSLGGR